MSIQTLRITARKSPLAMWEAIFVKTQLKKHHPTVTIKLIPMTTKGDILDDISLSKINGKGLFVKELEDLLLENLADIAVHSIKDILATFPNNLGLMAICQLEILVMLLYPISTDSLDSLQIKAL